MSLLGILTAQFSPPLRAVGLSHEANAFHRVLGRATLIPERPLLLIWTAWAMDGGATLFWDETLQVCHHGPRVTRSAARLAFRPGCTGIANFFGFLAWGCGMLLGIGSFYVVRRRSYALFMATHQLHWLWWFFACLHYPGGPGIRGAGLIFFTTSARRLVSERTVLMRGRRARS